MPSPFPGMAPYLENPELRSEVHSRLIVAIADALSPAVRPKYPVAIEKRIYCIDGEEDREWAEELLREKGYCKLYVLYH